ncbi:MAG: hypothetical protein JRH20_14070 [Deltaproteobacteria bacterium]|nr:hypothetical protein [Deltaproteobacteria bacterium]
MVSLKSFPSVVTLTLLIAACGAPEEWSQRGSAVESCGGFPLTPSSFEQSIESLSGYEPQEVCEPTPQPGVMAFRDLVLAAYPCTMDGGIARECDVGGVSEHKEGRAWDWMVEVGNEAAEDLISWLLAADAQGEPHAMARRLGVMYIVWNYEVWGAYRADDGWRVYTGDNPHTDHVHISFSWAGARKETSFWSASAELPDTPNTPSDGQSALQGSGCSVGSTPLSSKALSYALSVILLFLLAFRRRD